MVLHAGGGITSITFDQYGAKSSMRKNTASRRCFLGKGGAQVGFGFEWIWLDLAAPGDASREGLNLVRHWPKSFGKLIEITH